MLFFKKIDRYLIQYFFVSFLVVMVAIGFTIIVINMVGELRDFIDHSVPVVDILQYYVYFGGWVVKAFFPVFVLLSALFSISVLARKNEILAMKASGLSLYRIAWPLLIVALIMSVGHFYYSEYLFPPANKKRLEIKEFTIKKRSKHRYQQVTDVYRQIEPGYFYTIATFNVGRGEGKDLKVYRTKDNRLSQITTASRVVFIDHEWVAEDGIVRSFDDSAHESFTQFARLSLPDIKDKPVDLSKRIGKPEDMGLEELQGYIDLMKRTGGPYIREAIDLRLKYSYPLSSFIVILISIPFASNPRRGSIAVSFAGGALIALIYFVLFRILQSAGYNEKIPAWVAVWGVNGVFFLVGAVSMLKARK
ncbi:MAG: LptF/LptG family permease [Candidatus Zixiibacteriota bacterium]|nr:MAG: LptF/LptG family permease [candidate division Zixibacteria bacterium]